MACAECERRGKLVRAAWEALRAGDHQGYQARLKDLADSTKQDITMLRKWFSYEYLMRRFER